MSRKDRRGRRNVYLAIMAAAANGRGLHLTPAEVAALALDSAIENTALNELEAEESDDWAALDPSRPRKAGGRMRPPAER